MYRLTFTGTFEYHEGFLTNRRADAIFYTNTQGNFNLRYAGVEVDGLSAGAGELDSWTEDRANHVYTCLVEGKGERMPVRLDAPSNHHCLGSITVEIELLPETVPSVAARQQAAAALRATAELKKKQQEEEGRQQQETAKKLAEEQQRQKREEEQNAKQQAELDQEVWRLSVMVHHNENFPDVKFCDEYVKKNRETIMSLKAIWLNQYRTLMADAPLVAALQAKAPQVLDWYERRVELVNVAERLAVMPPEANVQLFKRKITARTLGQVDNAIAELFRLLKDIDQLRQQQASFGYDSSRQQQMEQHLRTMLFYFELLRAYGISAETPEEAEEKFFELRPYQPVLTIYEEIMEKIQAGKPVSPDVVKRRLDDLYREEIIRQAKRRQSIRYNRDDRRDYQDEQPSEVRREETRLKDFLATVGVEVEFPNYREREETRIEQFFKLMQEKDSMVAVCHQRGDIEGADQIEALFAQEQAKLFEVTADAY